MNTRSLVLRGLIAVLWVVSGVSDRSVASEPAAAVSAETEMTAGARAFD